MIIQIYLIQRQIYLMRKSLEVLIVSIALCNPFLFTDAPTLKHRIIFIILPIERPEIYSRLAVQQIK